MGRKLLFFPSCGSPSKTLSFRATASMTDDIDDMAATSETESSVESVIQGLSSDRFFFKPGKTNSILEEAKEKEKQSALPLEESVSMMEMESADPFVDFKKSMQEMVEADEGLKEWDNLQELLSLYLAVNDKINHGYIIGAFVDLMLVNLESTSSSASSSCSTDSLMNGQDQSLLMESGSSSSSSNNSTKKMISSESSDSSLSFKSSSASASTSASSSSTSHCLSSYSLEEEEDHNSPQKVAVSDDDSSLKV